MYLENWLPWKITEEQREKLAVRDPQEIYNFYMTNYEHICKVVYSFYGKSSAYGLQHLLTTEDLLQDVYLNLYYLPYENPAIFTVSFEYSLLDSYWGGHWSGFRYTRDVSERRKVCLCPLSDTVVGEDGDELNIVDIRPELCSPSPYVELLRAKEQARVSKLERDLERFLPQVMTKRNAELFLKGCNHAPIVQSLRKNKDKVIEFLRRHGTAERFLKLEPLPYISETDLYNSLERQAQKERWRWEEEHLDQLDSVTRAKVLKRICNRKSARSIRERERSERKEKLPSEIRAEQMRWEEAHLDELDAKTRRLAKRRIKRREEREGVHYDSRC